MIRSIGLRSMCVVSTLHMSWAPTDTLRWTFCAMQKHSGPRRIIILIIIIVIMVVAACHNVTFQHKLRSHMSEPRAAAALLLSHSVSVSVYGWAKHTNASLILVVPVCQCGMLDATTRLCTALHNFVFWRFFFLPKTLSKRVCVCDVYVNFNVQYFGLSLFVFFAFFFFLCIWDHKLHT